MAFRSPKNTSAHDNGSIPVEPKKKKKWPWILGAILLLLIIIAACSPKSSNTSSPAPSASSSTATTEATQEAAPAETTESAPAEETTQADKNVQTVELRATSTGTGNVMHGAGGSTNTEQFTTEWSKTVEGVKKSDGYMLTVTGDIMDQNSKVTCQILVDGKVEKEATGTGAGGGASCILDAKFW
ncbi:hypothetical protein [uncultured Rothia sp.]|uniref:hypothetical protein n=1 Tax=uncultured Rothia sp. TaxID=316088 RepID=UPI0032174068